MVITAHSEIMAATVIDGIPIIKWGKVATGDETPGDWMYWTAAITATGAINTTAICNLSKPCSVEFKPRVSSAMARKDCDDLYGTTEKVPFILGGRKGYITTVAKISDTDAETFSGHLWMVGATKYDLALAALATAGGASSISAVCQFIINGFNPETVADGDLLMKFTWI